MCVYGCMCTCMYVCMYMYLYIYWYFSTNIFLLFDRSDKISNSFFF